MMAHLVDEPLHKKLRVTVITVNPIKNSKEDELMGLTVPKDFKSPLPLQFDVLINGNLRRNRQLITLAHELVHVKQMSMGELGASYDTALGQLTRWKRKTYNEHHYDYYDYPWEIEANGREYGLYKRYMLFVTNNRRFIE